MVHIMKINRCGPVATTQLLILSFSVFVRILVNITTPQQQLNNPHLTDQSYRLLLKIEMINFKQDF